MSKAYELGLTMETRKNWASTTIPAYVFVKLCTTLGGIDLITTRGEKMYGVSQEVINPLAYGKVAICDCGGISRLKMVGTAYTTATLDTTGIWIGSAGTVATHGRGARMTTSTVYSGGQGVGCTWAASDIIAVSLRPPARYKL